MKPKRKDTQVPQPSGPTEHVANEAVYKELDPSKATPKESSPKLHHVSGPMRPSNHGIQFDQTRVESSGDEQDLGEDVSKQGKRINDIDVDEDITLVNVQDDADNEMFNEDTLNGDEEFLQN
ncbi:hypothetical protein Tco_1209284 [Tanacetum coccineum]